MLDQLLNLVKEYAEEPVIRNQEIPNQQNQDIVAEATNTVASGLQNVMAGGGVQNIIQMFTGGDQNNVASLMKNPMVAMMIGHFTQKLVSKYNMSPQAAGSVASQLIPDTLKGLIQKSNDPTNSQFDLNGILDSLSGGGQAETGNGGFDIGGLISRFTGGGMDVDGDGDVDMQDMIAKFTSRAQNNIGRQQQGGGIMDMLKGLMGN
ncbi:MAG: hypothetical protein GC171_13410 [Terrimonas sp.]|nr:hypothetical protein [Terrimonas sp.]